MISTSDAFTPNGRTRVQIIWTLSVKPVDDTHCEYTNSVVAHPTVNFYHNFAYAEIGCDLLVYPRDQDRSTIAYTVELVEVSYREVVGFRAP